MFPLLAKITILSDAHNPAARSTPGGQQLCIVNLENMMALPDMMPGSGSAPAPVEMPDVPTGNGKGGRQKKNVNQGNGNGEDGDRKKKAEK